MNDDLVADYLSRVRAAAAGLDPGRREELIEDLREHIGAARAELSPETEVGVRTVLERLGDPAAIVAEASAAEPPATPVAAPAAEPPPVPAPRSNRALMAVLITVLAMFLIGPLILCIGGIAYLMPVTREGGPSPVVSEEIPAPSHTPTPS
jgi:uncharacterized membrane protein